MSTPTFTDIPLPIPGTDQDPGDHEHLEEQWRQLSRPPHTAGEVDIPAEQVTNG